MPTEFVTGLRRVLTAARAIGGQLGLHPYDVALVVDSWSGARAGEGTKTQTVTAITEYGQPPKVRSAGEKRVALGLAEVGELTIGPLTQVEGSSWATLTQSGVSTGNSVKLRLTYRETGEVVYYRIKHVDEDSALHIMLVVVPVTE